MQFHIPQFIDIEDKIFGPFTFKQFAYIIGALGTGFLAWSVLPRFIAILIIVPLGGLTFMLAFKPVGGRPFSAVLEGAFKYFFGGKLYLWKKEKTKDTKLQKIGFEEAENTEKKIPRVVEGKLDSLSWNLDTSEKQE